MPSADPPYTGTPGPFKPRIQISTTEKKTQWWQSRQSIPPLQESVLRALSGERLEFPINEACTSLTIVPSGRHVVAGFTDGTLRLFDLTGSFHALAVSHASQSSSSSSDTDTDTDEEEALFEPTTKAKSALVCSRAHQRYGAVACQIHAKGVHTSLIMKVDVSPDGLYAFGGVARGSMELVAVDLSQVEAYHDHGHATTHSDILDLVTVETHSDAKLRGFGACTRLDDKYLLLTGRGIKNIHIWAFSPHSSTNKWECWYDTQTNGNTISLLHFRYDALGNLQAMSKSDGQKVRVWDLSSVDSPRPKRPPFTDIPSTESAMCISGNFCLGGCHAITLVNLDILEGNLNHTELALPGSTIKRVGRQQRGELQTLQNVVGMMDGSQALLEMSDGSILQYSQGQHMPKLQAVPSSVFPTYSTESTCTLGLARIGLQGYVVAAMASQSTAGRGTIVLRKIGQGEEGVWREETPLKPASRSIVTPAATKSMPLPATQKSMVVRKQNIVESPDREIEKVMVESPDSLEHHTKNKHMVNTGIAISPEQTKVTPEVKKISKTFFAPKVSKKSSQDALRPTAAKSQALCSVNLLELADNLAKLTTEDDRLKIKSTERTIKIKLSDNIVKIKSTDNENKIKPRDVFNSATTTDAITNVKPPERNMFRNVKEADSVVKIKSVDILTKIKPADTGVKDKSVDAAFRIKSADTCNKSADNAFRIKSADTCNKSADNVLQSKAAKRLHHKKSHKRASKTIRTKSPVPLPRKCIPEDAEAARSPSSHEQDVVEALLLVRGRTASPAPKKARTQDGIKEYGRIVLPRPLASELPTSTLRARVLRLNEINPSFEVTRMKMALEHRAAHDRIRKRVLTSVDVIIRSFAQQPSPSAEEARGWLEGIIRKYQIVLEETIGRQTLEAESMAALQTRSNGGNKVAALTVSYPFPEVFQQARESLSSFLANRRQLSP